MTWESKASEAGRTGKVLVGRTGQTNPFEKHQNTGGTHKCIVCHHPSRRPHHLLRGRVNPSRSFTSIPRQIRAKQSIGHELPYPWIDHLNQMVIVLLPDISTQMHACCCHPTWPNFSERATRAISSKAQSCAHSEDHSLITSFPNHGTHANFSRTVPSLH